MPDPGQVVAVDFLGATGLKRRPAVIVSSGIYHQHRPDVIVAVITSRIAEAVTPTDWVLRDWMSAGLRRPSAYRSYFGMTTPSAIRTIGRLSEHDWRNVQACISRAFAVS